VKDICRYASLIASQDYSVAFGNTKLPESIEYYFKAESFEEHKKGAPNFRCAIS
jgi:hypothetical protein